VPTDYSNAAIQARATQRLADAQGANAQAQAQTARATGRLADAHTRQADALERIAAALETLIPTSHSSGVGTLPIDGVPTPE
jgi:hypothetical protein